MRELMQKPLRRIISMILVVCVSVSAFLVTPISPTAFAAEQDESNKAPMRRVIDNEHPVDLFTYYPDNGFPTPSTTNEGKNDPTLKSGEYDDNINSIKDIIAATPEDLRDSLVILLIAGGNRTVNPDSSNYNWTAKNNDYTQTMQTYYQLADICEELNVDFIIQQIQGESRVDAFIPMEEFQHMADNYEHFIGFNMAELDNGVGWRGDMYGNQSTYIADAINFSAENGMFVFWKDSNNGQFENGMFFDFIQDNQYLYDSMQANSENVVLMYKQSFVDIETASTILGLWLGGFADNWGIAPDWWGYGNTTSINGAGPSRTNAPDTQYAMNLMRSLMNGGTVTAVEAGYYAMNSYGARIASAMNVIYPLFQDMKHGRLSIPSKEEVLNNIQAVALGRAAYGGKGDGGVDIRNYTDFTWKPIDPTLNGIGVNQATGKYGLIPSLPLNTDEEELQQFRDAGIEIVTTQQDQSYYDTLYPDNTLPGTTAFAQNVANTQWWFMNSIYVSETYARTNKDRMQTAKIVPVKNKTTSVDITMPIAGFGYMNESEEGMNFTFNNYIIDHRNMPGGYQWPPFYSLAYRKQADGTYAAINDDSLETSGRKTTIKVHNQNKKPEVTFIDYDPTVNGIEDIYETPKYEYKEWFENGEYTLEILHNGKVDFNITTHPDGSDKKELGLNYTKAEELRAEIFKADAVDRTGKTASSVQLLTDTISKAETALAEKNAAAYTTILDRLRYAEGKLISSANASATTSIVSNATNDRLELSIFNKTPTKLKITGFTPANPKDVFLSYEVIGDSAEVKQITNYDYEITPKQAGEITITFKTTSGSELSVTVEVYESDLVYRNVAENATVIGHGKFENAQNLVKPGQYGSLHTGLDANKNYKQSELPEGEKLWQDISSPTNVDGSPNTTGTFADDYFIVDLGKEFDIEEINYGVGGTAHHKGTIMILGNSPEFTELWNQAPATKVANAGLDKKDWYIAWMTEGYDGNVPATIFPQFGGANMNYSEQLPNYHDQAGGYTWNAIGNRTFSSDFNKIQSSDSGENPPDVRAWLRTEGNKYRYILVTSRASASQGDFARVNINLKVMANDIIEISNNNYEALQERVNEAKVLDEGYKHDGSYKYSPYSRLNLTQQISKANYIISQKDVHNTIYSQVDIDKAVGNLDVAMSLLVETEGLHGLIQDAWEIIHEAGYVYGGGVHENYGTNGTKITGGPTNVYINNLKNGPFNKEEFTQLYRDLQYFMWSYRAPTSVWSEIVPDNLKSNIRLNNSGDLNFGKDERWTIESVTAKQKEIDKVSELLQARINEVKATDKSGSGLLSISAPTAITGLPNGTAKTAEALGLPSTVELVTDGGRMNGNVIWNVGESSYDPAQMTAQTFNVTGTVTLPTWVVNPNNVSLTTSIGVTVLPKPKAFDQIEAESFDSKSGGINIENNTPDIGGGKNLGNVSDGNYLVYKNIDFVSGASEFSARVAADKNAGGTIEIRIDSPTGTLAGTLTVSDTGGWSNYKTITSPITRVTGIHDVYLVFKTSKTFVCNLNWFKFNAGSKVVTNITEPEAITGVANGREKTAEALGLPSTVEMLTDAGSMNANVTWNIEASSYDPAVKTAQTFAVNGEVTLPDGVTNPDNVVLTTSIQVTVLEASAMQPTLVSITAPGAITDLANGTAKTAEALGLPATVELNTDAGSMNANVTWNVEASSYDPAVKEEQTFTVDGAVILPEGVNKPDNVALTTSIQVTVLEASSIPPTLDSITAPKAITGVANGTAKTAEALGLPATVELITDAGSMNTNVSWNVEASSYDPAVKEEQTFTVDGAVTLPEGVNKPDNVALTTSIQVTVLEASSMPPTLDSITAPAAITGLANGTAKTAKALGLPSTVELVTDGGNVNANVVWNVDASSYNPSSINAQTFTVDGTVTLPEGVSNPKDIELTTQIRISVKATASSRPDPTPTPTPTPDPTPTPKPDDGNKPTEQVKPIEPETPKVELSDIARHWAKASIEKSVELGFVSGYEDGTFRPNGAITRGEFATMLARALKLGSVDSKFSFTDQGQTPVWAQPFIQAIARAGFISGYEDGTFRSNHEITRSELVVIVVRAMGLEVNPKVTLAFDDADLVPVWAKPYVATAAEAGLIKGNGDGKVNPNASSTRAEAIILILGMLSNVK